MLFVTGSRCRVVRGVCVLCSSVKKKKRWSACHSALRPLDVTVVTRETPALSLTHREWGLGVSSLEYLPFRGSVLRSLLWISAARVDV